jgi:formylglycine-generating enzyme
MINSSSLLTTACLAIAFSLPASAGDFALGADTGYAKLNAAGVGLSFSTIGDPGNSAATPSSRGWGKVDYVYSMATTEVSWAQYAVFLNDTGCSSYMFQSSGASYIGLYQNSDGSVGVRAGCADKAVCYIRYSEAVAFSNWLGTGSATQSGSFNLPTASEWYKAAYYDANRYGTGQGGYWLYGTGTDTLTEADAFYGYLAIEPNNSQWPEVDYGMFNQNGLYGMTAGVEEWTSTAQNGAGTRHWVLGGSWGNQAADLTNARLNNLADTSANAKTGFRVSTTLTAVPEPSTFALGLGALALGWAAWRRRNR